MVLRVAYVECTGDLWSEIAESLRRERSWDPVYWSGAGSMQREVERRFPSVAFHENTGAVKGQSVPANLEVSLPPLDETLLAKLSYVQSIALHMMDRMDPDGSFTHRERVRLYYRHLQLALALLETLEPDLLVFSAAPHLVYDYVLYHLSRLREIPTVVFTETAVDGLVFSSSSFESAAELLGEAYARVLAQGRAAAVSPRAENYLERVAGDYTQAVPDYVIELQRYQPQGRSEAASEEGVSAKAIEAMNRLVYHARPLRTARPTSPLGSKIRALLRNLLFSAEDYHALEAVSVAQDLQRTLAETGRANMEALVAALHCTRHLYRAIETEFPLHVRADLPAEDSYLKQFAVSPEASRLSYLEYWLYRVLALKKRQSLLARYQEVVRPADVSQPFVYVPLQYQPEMTTSPLGGVYVEQTLMVEALAKTVPSGWSVYVREHPFQFDRKGSGELARDLEFYRKLGELPNVWLVPLETSPFDLIDAAQAVATMTGTSGWEAIIRGKPALVFGSAWYSRCEGAFAARDIEACRKALVEIESGYRVNRERVRLFLETLENVGFRGYTIPDLSSAAAISMQQNVARFVEELKRYEPSRKSLRSSGREDAPDQEVRRASAGSG